jgi:hypothetical protein
VACFFIYFYKLNFKFQTMSTGRIVSMAVTGAALGAGIGFLFCTKSGREVLEKLTSGKGDLKENLKAWVTNFFGGMADKVKRDLTESGDEADAAGNATMGTA